MPGRLSPALELQHQGPGVGPTPPQVNQAGSASTDACQGQLGRCPTLGGTELGGVDVALVPNPLPGVHLRPEQTAGRVGEGGGGSRHSGLSFGAAWPAAAFLLAASIPILGSSTPTHLTECFLRARLCTGHFCIIFLDSPNIPLSQVLWLAPYREGY